MSVWNWLSRTYGYHKMRRPGQDPPSNTIFTGQNTRGGPVNGDAAAAMMAIANERASVQAEEAAAAATGGRKKTTKKSKKKDALAEDSGRGGSVVDGKPEDSKDSAVDSSRPKPKPKKKKDALTAGFATVAPKGKKRAAEEMSETGSVNTAAQPPPSPSQPGRPAVGSDKKSIIIPPQALPKKMTKKQQRAFDAAERERLRQEAAAAAASAAASAQPPKKKAKKNANGASAPTAASSVPLATPSVRPIGLADIAPNGTMPEQFGNFGEQPVDLTGDEYNQMVPPNLLDPSLPPDLANMPIGEVPENIFLAAAADVDFNFPFASGGPDGGGMDTSGIDFGAMAGQNQDDVGMALAMLQQGQMPDMGSRQPEQSRAPPGS